MPERPPENNVSSAPLDAFLAALDRWRALTSAWNGRTPRAIALHEPDPEWAEARGELAVQLEEMRTEAAIEARAVLATLAEHGPAVVALLDDQGDRARSRLVFEWLEAQQESRHDAWTRQVWGEVRGSTSYALAMGGRQTVEDQPAVDGVCPPDRFVWKGTTVDGLSPDQYRLLDCLSEGGQLRRIPLHTVANVIYAGTRRQPHNAERAIAQLCHRTREKLDSVIHGGAVRVLVTMTNGHVCAEESPA